MNETEPMEGGYKTIIQQSLGKQTIIEGEWGKECGPATVLFADVILEKG